MSDRTERDPLESTAIDAKRIVIVAASVLVFLGASIGMLAFAYYTLVPRNGPPAPRDFPQPRLEAHPGAELRSYLTEQRERLNGYHWANSDHSLVVIPIDRAMTIIAARGAGAFAPLAPQPQTQRQP
jgi:hypothetical protein